MIHLEIRTYKRGEDGESVEAFSDIIDERDITLGEALELVFGEFWNMNSIANIHSGLERLRIYDSSEIREIAISYELFRGRNPERVPYQENHYYNFWHSFTLPEKGKYDYRQELTNAGDLLKLYDSIVVYALHFEDKDTKMWLAPEVRRHIERQHRHAHRDSIGV